MNDSELREKGPPSEFDNTMLSYYKQCPRYLYWFLRGLYYKRTPSYFVYGRAWGAVLNDWHGTAGRPLELRKTQALLVGRRIWEAENIEIFDNRPNDSWENLEQTFDLYVDIYGEEESWVQVKGEQGFCFPIPGTTISYGGAIDAYVEWKGYGILAREDKAPGGYITPGYAAQWSRVSQIAGYYWALLQLVEKPFGILMNIASKRPRKNPEDRFSRFLEKRSKWRIAEFMRDTVLLADDVRREWDRGRWFWAKLGERDSYACAGGPGKSPCVFRDLCLQEAFPWDIEEDLDVFQNYSWREKKWAPWKREGKEEQ